MISSGSTGPPRRSSRSLPGGWRRNRLAWPSRPARSARSWPGCRSWWWRACGTVMRGCCWTRCSPGRWTRGCETRSSPRREAIRWRCWSCRGGCGPLSWRVDSGCPARLRCRGGSRRASSGSLTLCRPRPGAWCSSRRPIRSATSVLVWRAAERLGIGAGAATRAAEAGLLEFGAQVRFRHPLVRSMAYRSASLRDRQEMHRALAEVTDPQLDPDRRAWHWAQAVSGPDEDVAAELEHSAGRAQARGAWPRLPRSWSGRRC